MSDLDPAERFRRIQEREAEVKRREAELRKQNVAPEVTKPPNFPSCRPLIHHDIANDIPMLAQWTVRLHLIGFIALYVTLFWNFIAACSLGEAPGGHSVGQTVIFSIVIFGLAIICTWKLNYMKLYSQCEKGNIKVGMFALQGLMVAAVAAGTVGIIDSGCVGIIAGIDGMGSPNSFCKFACLVSMILWIAETAWQMFMFTKIILLYKVLGNSTMGPVDATRIPENEA